MESAHSAVRMIIHCSAMLSWQSHAKEMRGHPGEDGRAASEERLNLGSLVEVATH
jgi:hypothetical protein